MISFAYTPLRVFVTGLVMLASTLPIPAFSATDQVAIVPKPAVMSLSKGFMPLSPNSRIYYTTRSSSRPIESSLKPIADVLAEEIELITGMRLPVLAHTAQRSRAGDIYLQFDDKSPALALAEDSEKQSYTLSVTNRVVIKSQYTKGVSYGTATLVQALSESSGEFSVRRMEVRDQPDSPYRAVMIDVARQRHSIDTLKDVVRMARLYKIRYLHLHLTDDQNFVFPFEPVTKHLSKNYTLSREVLKDLVAYADARGVTIVPELDLPGHSRKLRKSGYLKSAKNDADVAAPIHYRKVKNIIDDMLSIFSSTPYFHMGGDESGAGPGLVPFLAEMNRHIRSHGKRMLVWEGFKGAPTSSLPATGPDRVIVLSWESSYNPPWSLLDNGYTVINASWKPLYVVAHGRAKRPGSASRMWSAEAIYSWDADTFMHWEPRRPLYHDKGPSDPDRTDSTWKASYIGRQDQVLGGQLLLWENTEQWVIEDLRSRLPALAERLWNGSADSYSAFVERLSAVEEKVLTIVRPIEIEPESLDLTSPVVTDYRVYDGEAVSVTLRNRSRISGKIRYETTAWKGRLDRIYSGTVPEVTADSSVYAGAFSLSGAVGVRARLFRENGTAVDGTDWQVFNNWKQRVRVTDYMLARDEFPANAGVPDTEEIRIDRLSESYLLPMVRGRYIHTDRVLQRQDATLEIETGGSYSISASTRSGRASVYLDLDRDGVLETNERLISNTSQSEASVKKRVVLTPGYYPMRIDHLAELPRPLLSVTLKGPDTGSRIEDISNYLLPIGLNRDDRLQVTGIAGSELDD